MLSILIPIYNFDVRQIVQDLHEQATTCAIQFEILCYDDASEKSYAALNSAVSDFEHVTYKILPSNYGRSAIRNVLAEDAQFKNILFLDCDGATKDKKFIKNYISALKLGEVVCGGRSYYPTPPSEKSLYLRWLYGVERESISAELRKKHQWKSFMTNNFAISKYLYNTIKLDESLSGYGHEDTLFGMELKKQLIPITHIDNPLIHIGLEKAEDFLAKTHEGIQNLHKLIQDEKVDLDVTLYRFYERAHKLGLAGYLRRRFMKKETKLLSSLCSENPKLTDFDFYKLGHLLLLDEGVKK